MSNDLYRLLGLPADTPPSRLRQVYEEHVTSAVRSSDHRRALELSSALDNLDPETRARVYPRMASHDPRPSGSRPAARPSVSRPRAPRRSMSARRALVYIAVVLGIGVLVYLDVAQSKPETPSSQLAFPGAPAGSSALPEESTSPVLPSRYQRQAARVAHVAVRAVNQCRETTGALPPSAPTQSGRATLRCGDGAITLDLGPARALSYSRISARRYTLTVTTSNGGASSYDSKSGLFTS